MDAQVMQRVISLKNGSVKSTVVPFYLICVPDWSNFFKAEHCQCSILSTGYD